MRKFFVIFMLALIPTMVFAQQKITVTWQLSDNGNLSANTVTGNSGNYVSVNYLSGSQIANTSMMASGNADNGYTAPTYDPPFTQFYVTSRQSGKTTGHNIAFGVTPTTGHTFKPTKISFDAAKCGTDGGNFDVYVKVNGGGEQAVATTQVPLRNKVGAGNPNGYSHHEYTVSDLIAKDGAFILFLYIYNINGTDNENPKAIAFRNVVIEGVADEPVYDASHYIADASFKTAKGATISLTNLIKNLPNGGLASYPDLLYGDPTDFQVTATDGFSCDVTYKEKTAAFNVKNGAGETVFTFKVNFRVTYRTEKPTATPLKRGLIAVNLSSSGSSGNLVSWRHRQSDGDNVKFKLYRGTSAKTQNYAVNDGKFIYARTNFRDASGNISSYYRLEVYDLDDNLIETEVSGKTWKNQSMEIPTSTPTDTRGLGATYTPNDATFCDMDGDGEYEIVVKWEPSNAKDSASDGVTSSNYIDCYKLDGTQLWRIDIGPNLRSGAHTSPFLCWDFDGDGYGELICKTAPGTVDGEGNYVVMGNDDPTASWLNGRGKPDAGPEYVTVFDGLTGAELASTRYHTKYGDVSTDFWGDSNQNRSERYLACVAYLDGVTPSAVMCRGYYSGASLGAYNWDGMQLTRKWLHRSSTSGKELWGEGAHFVVSADVDDDGCDEIVYGSACLDHDGKKTVYRTGLKHGDALHVGDFDWDNPGQEVFMVHESSPYGYDLRDAKTGKLLVRQTASGDTGRGLAANFSAAHDGAELMASCTGALLDCKGNVIADSWAIGSSGAGINARIYWKGDPYDEFFDKSIIAHWNDKYNSFDRVQVNGSNYTPGTLCNGTKNNPCVMGDMLGDWREELVTYNSSTNALIITATSFESNYCIPHLMEDRQYAELIANQNCAYNQPPHLSYDPARQFVIHLTIPETGWLPYFAPHSLMVPDDVEAYYVNNGNTNDLTLKLTTIPTTVPAKYGFLIKGKPGQQVTFKPADNEGTANSDNKLGGDAFFPIQVENSGITSYYKWEYRDDVGLGYFKVTDALTVNPREPYLKLTGSLAKKDYYLIEGTATAIDNTQFTIDNSQLTIDDGYYTIDGRHFKGTPSTKGVYIVNGKKVVVK